MGEPLIIDSLYSTERGQMLQIEEFLEIEKVHQNRISGIEGS